MEDLEKKKEAFAELLEVIATLRVECPWDRKQTMESLRALSIEEVYELGDAILAGDMAEVKKELGDLLMHIVFYAQIGSEKEAFDITDVLNSICEKCMRLSGKLSRKEVEITSLTSYLWKIWKRKKRLLPNYWK